MSDVRIGIVGCAGRMGVALVREVTGHPNCVLVGGCERPDSDAIGRDVGEMAGVGTLGYTITDAPETIFADADVILDFTTTATTEDHAALAATHGAALVIGTTGLEVPHMTALENAAQTSPVVQAANMSLGVNLLIQLTRQVAETLDPDFDIEIVEMHHRYKVDAPSGTALALGNAAAEGRGVDLDGVAARGRDGVTGERKRGDIGFAVLRGGNVVGDHTVVFAADNERVELTHRADDRTIFARGAVRAAVWTHGKPAGLYGMADVLGFSN
jgi:4-hydroxy-tetrahydrodipicolinate reductase